jgi:hypothetical protein
VKTWNVLRFNGVTYDTLNNLDAETLGRKLRAGEISWVDFVVQGDGVQRLYAVPALGPWMPIPPRLDAGSTPPAGEKSQIIQAKPREDTRAIELEAPSGPAPKAAPASSSSLWFLQFEGTEFGPISINELQTVVQTGKMRGTLYAWSKGMENWHPVSALEELSHLFQGAPQGLAARPPSRFNKVTPDHEGRGAARSALVATVWRLQGRKEREIIGICADISISGMQVVVDNSQAANDKGSQLELEIVPVGLSGLNAIRVQGKVVWKDSAVHRIGVQFTQVSPKDSLLIESYVGKASETSHRSV